MDKEELKKYIQWMEREYGPEYRDVIRDQLRTNQFGSDLPGNLGLLDSREDAEQVLGYELVDAEAPPLKQVPLMKDMLRTSGVPYWDNPETAGSKIPFPKRAFVGTPSGNPSWAQTEALYDQGQSNYYGPSGNQNRISPLPHQLEGPETSPGDGSVPARFYDPNQELYDPNYYGTSGQIGQMGSPPPGIIPSSVTGRHTSQQSPYSVTGMSAMSGGEMPGLLGPSEGQFSQVFPGPDSDDRIVGSDQFPEWARQPAGLLTETSSKGGKWEETPEGRDSIFRRKKKNNGMDNYLAKYLMQLGNQMSSDENAGWRSN